MSDLQVELHLNHQQLLHELDQLIRKANKVENAKDFMDMLTKAYDSIVSKNENNALETIKQLQENSLENVDFDYNGDKLPIIITRLRPSNDRLGKITILPKNNLEVDANVITGTEITEIRNQDD